MKTEADKDILIALLKADVKFLLSFAPKDVKIPSDLFPTMYHTLTHEGDQDIADRVQDIMKRHANENDIRKHEL